MDLRNLKFRTTQVAQQALLLIKVFAETNCEKQLEHLDITRNRCLGIRRGLHQCCQERDGYGQQPPPWYS